MNNIPTHILIKTANMAEKIEDRRKKTTELVVSGELWILTMDKELENRYQSVRNELEAYEEFTSLPPHQLF